VKDWMNRINGCLLLRLIKSTFSIYFSAVLSADRKVILALKACQFKKLENYYI
jgi:hypothetical protein